MRMQEHQNKLETNVEGETQHFGIGNARKIIRILRDKLYSHKVRTLVQEYISNARDAMRECGKGNSFEVTVPTRLNPVFKVRDFGPGLTPDRVANVFIMYGSSTKDNDDTQTGGFGIGAKSAWSYTDSFTIVSVVDGVKRSYVAHTGVDSAGRLDLISTEATDEPNGTEIQVAVKPYDLEEFRSSIFRAIYFWKDKPTLKGELSPPTLESGQVISELLEVIDNDMLPDFIRNTCGHYNDDAIAVIDGIPYPLTGSLREKVKAMVELDNLTRGRVILHVANGVLDVAASRESIDDSKYTIAGLEKISQRALTEAQTWIAAQFGAVKSTPEYLRTYSTVSKLFDADSFATYNGYTITSNIIQNPLFSKVKMTLVHCMGKYGRGRVDKITKDEMSEARRKIELKHLDDLFFVSTPDNKIIENKRIREYFKGKNYLVMLEVLHSSVAVLDAKGKPVLDKDGKPTFQPVSYVAEYQKLIDELGAKDFQSITYVDPPKVKKERVKREDAEICLHRVRGDRHIYTTLATNTQKWFYVQLDGGSWPTKYPRPMLGELQDYFEEVEDAKICGVSERVAKMIANDKNFISLDSELAKFKPTKECVLAAKAKIAKQGRAYQMLCKLKDLEDKFVLEMLGEYKAMEKNKLGELPGILFIETEKDKEVKEFKENDEKFGKLMKGEYPLVEELGDYCRNTKELVFYMNAKYQENKGKRS